MPKSWTSAPIITSPSLPGRRIRAAGSSFLSDFRRQMLPSYGAMQTDEKSPVYRYARRADFIIDKTGTVKFMKGMDNSLDLLDAEEVLKATKAAAS